MYEWDTKVGVIFEIPGLSKKDLSVEVTDGVLQLVEININCLMLKMLKVLRRELKESSFKRQFELGEELDGKNISSKFEDENTIH